MTKIDRGIVSAILAPIFIAIAVMFVNFAGKYAHPFLIAALSPLISILFLFPILWVSKEKLFFKEMFTNLKIPFYKVLFFRSIIGQVLIVWGFTSTTLVKSILLLRLEPLFVLIWSVFLLGEKSTVKKFILVGLLIIGTLFVVSPNDPISAINVGDLMIIAALASLSYSYIPTEKIVKKSNALSLTAVSNLVSGIFLTVIALLIFSGPAFNISLTGWGLILGGLLAFNVIGITLFFYAFKTVKPWIISSFLSLQVIVGIFLAIVFAGEAMTNMQIIGAIIIMAATYLIGRARKDD